MPKQATFFVVRRCVLPGCTDKAFKRARIFSEDHDETLAMYKNHCLRSALHEARSGFKGGGYSLSPYFLMKRMVWPLAVVMDSRPSFPTFAVIALPSRS